MKREELDIRMIEGGYLIKASIFRHGTTIKGYLSLPNVKNRLFHPSIVYCFPKNYFICFQTLSINYPTYSIMVHI